MAVSHWHVIRHTDDDDPFITNNIGAAFDYAAGELDTLASLAHDEISGAGEAGDYEAAYRAWQREMALHNLHQNAANMAEQWGAEHEDDRAPLYRGDGATGRLIVASEHMRDEIGTGSPIKIITCPLDECRPDDDPPRLARNPQ